jgi:cellulose synthase (UDP-forming)
MKASYVAPRRQPSPQSDSVNPSAPVELTDLAESIHSINPASPAQGVQPRPTSNSRQLGLPHTTTLVLLTALFGFSVFAGAWLLDLGGMEQFFAALHQAQQSPPEWLRVPNLAGEYLLIPTIGLLCLGLAITKLSPQPRPWPRAIMVSILVVLLVRYLSWRLMATLNLADPINGVLSFLLLGLELQVICNQMIQLFLTLAMRDRHKEADRYEVAVRSGEFAPPVDVLIPTYNEPVFILKRTVIGCQSMDYANKDIYLLDDSRRPEVAALAQELGCHYINRSDRRHAKAGNLNNALQHTQNELIVVFDADFVPTTNFLQRTVGFFQNPAHALVQTYQSFYNPDPVARNLGLETEVPQEAESFSRFYQRIRDGVDTALCYGSSFVVRRSALNAAGGFVTESVSEDYFTGIRLAARGHKVVFLAESLSAGLSAENMADHVAQRDRWARGSLQAFFISANPLTIKGLSLLQRIAHFDGLLQWFGSLSRIGFLLMPLVYAFWGLTPFNTDVREFVYFFLPYYLVQLTTYGWLNLRSRSAFISDVYAVAQCFPVTLSVVQTMMRPFSKGFRVTPKGVSNSRYIFNWQLATPLIITFVLMVWGMFRNLSMAVAMEMGQNTIPFTLASQPVRGMGLSLTWSIYNLVMLTLALFVMLDVPNPDRYDWFNLKRQVRLWAGNGVQNLSCGQTTMISQGGMMVALTETPTPAHPLMPNATVQFEILEPDSSELNSPELSSTLKLTGTIERIHRQHPSEPTLVDIRFGHLSLAQERQLVKLLYCRPGQWHQYRAPGELRSLWLLLKAALRPRVLFERRPQIQAVKVSQG